MREPTSPFDLLGHHVKDINTGFAGIATAYVEHLHGCNHIAIEPSECLTNGKVGETYTFDEQRIQFVREGPKRKAKTTQAKTKLGSSVRHKINGYEGTAVNRTTWVNHCPTVGIEPTGRGTNGELLVIETFDEEMVEIIKVGEPKFSDTYKKRMGMFPKPTTEQRKRGTGSSPGILDKVPGRI